MWVPSCRSKHPEIESGMTFCQASQCDSSVSQKSHRKRLIRVDSESNVLCNKTINEMEYKFREVMQQAEYLTMKEIITE